MIMLISEVINKKGFPFFSSIIIINYSIQCYVLRIVFIYWSSIPTLTDWSMCRFWNQRLSGY